MNVSTEQGDDYNTGCLLHYEYFKDNYRLIAVDLSKQKASKADPRAIQRIVFQGKAGQRIRLYAILKNQKKQSQNFTKQQQKFCEQYKWLNTIR